MDSTHTYLVSDTHVCGRGHTEFMVFCVQTSSLSITNASVLRPWTVVGRGDTAGFVYASVHPSPFGLCLHLSQRESGCWAQACTPCLRTALLFFGTRVEEWNGIAGVGWSVYVSVSVQFLRTSRVPPQPHRLTLPPGVQEVPGPLHSCQHFFPTKKKKVRAVLMAIKSNPLWLWFAFPWR